MAQFNQLILDNMARGAAKEGERRANVGNPNQRLVWRGGKWEDDGQVDRGSNQLISDNIARGAAKEGDYRTNVGNPNQRLQLRKDSNGVLGWEDAGSSGAMSPAGSQISYKSSSAGGSAQQPTQQPTQQPQQATGMMGQPTSFVSRLQNLENPFGANYQAQLQGQATSNAARQYQQAANRTRALLASRGLMSGGGTGLEAQMLNQAYSESMGNRDRALSEALTNTAAQRADFEFRRAQGLMSAAEMDALLPSRQRSAEAAARSADVAAGYDERTVGARERVAQSEADKAMVQADIAKRTAQSEIDIRNYQADQQKSQADIMRADAALKQYTPEQRQELIDLFMRDARSRTGQSEAELEAAKKVLERGNIQDLPLWGKALIIGGGALGGFLLGGPAGALAGAQLGSIFTGTLSGQDAQAIGQMAKPYLPGQTQQTPGVALPPVARPPGMPTYIPPVVMPRTPRVP